MSLKRNVVANYIGQGTQALMAFAFVPLYIRYLGMEAYGLIGIFALLQSWLGLLDMGTKPALGREMARFTAGVHDSQSIRDLLRSIEITGIAVAGVVGLAIWASSGWMAAHWITAKHLPLKVIAQSFTVMGLVAALRFVEDIYVSCIVGLQKLVLQNVVISILATARGLGSVGILIWVSPTLTAFFLWQGLISVISALVLALIVYKTLPTAPSPARFSSRALINVWRFAAGMMTITILAMLLTQVDKILLSRLLTLEAFGYYALAGGVAGGLYMLLSPINGAIYPRLTQLVASGDIATLRGIYHKGAQSVTVLVGSATVVLMLFSARVLRLWTGNSFLASHTAPLISVLVIGTCLNAFMAIPYQLQLAYGWTSLSVSINAVAVSIFIPALLWIVPAKGAIGAAWVWVALNTGYLIFAVPLMHRRLLPEDKWQWYGQDVALPLAAAVASGLLLRAVMPRDLNKFGEFSVLAIVSICVLGVAGLAAPLIRAQALSYLPRRIQSLNPAGVHTQP